MSKIYSGTVVKETFYFFLNPEGLLAQREIPGTPDATSSYTKHKISFPFFTLLTRVWIPDPLSWINQIRSGTLLMRK
jgi:hypothetical protein